MKIKKNGFDTFYYYLFCIATLGGAWVARVVITQAIKHALDDK